MIKSIDQINRNVRPFVVNKLWTLTDASEGIYGDEGLQVTSSDFISESAATNTSGRFKRSVYDQMNIMYYKFSDKPLLRFGGAVDIQFESRSLHNRINVMSIPQRYYGNQIRPSSVVIVDVSGGVSKTYLDDGSGSLYDQASSSEHVGNVFYQQGLITCTHTGSYYSSSFLGTGAEGFTVNFDSTTTLYETEILCSLGEGEFNVSTNPTAVNSGSSPLEGVSGSVKDLVLDDFKLYEFSSSVDPTGSYLAPFVTEIGLYDDDLNLVVVAKLAKPVKKLPDYSLNFLIRFDT